MTVHIPGVAYITHQRFCPKLFLEDSLKDLGVVAHAQPTSREHLLSDLEVELTQLRQVLLCFKYYRIQM